MRNQKTGFSANLLSDLAEGLVIELLGPFEPEQHRAALLFRIAFAFDLYHAVPHLFADLAFLRMTSAMP